MAKGYRPNRPVTSEKIREDILDLVKKQFPEAHTRASVWKRSFKRRLPESRGWVRGYDGHFTLKGKSQYYCAIAISTEDDTELTKLYLCSDADQECKSLGVLEVMMSDD